jgi:hypothetical protein
MTTRAAGRVFIILLALTCAATRLEAAVGTVTISPTSGPPGTMVAVTVSGFSPSPPSGGSGAGDLYPYEILLDGFNFAYPGSHDILGYAHNLAQPFTYTITIPMPVNWPANPTVAGSTHTIDYQHSGSDTSTPAIFKVTGPASQIVLVSGAGQTLMTGSTSGVITAELRDAFGTPVRGITNGTSLTLTTTSSGGSFIGASNQTVTAVTVPSTATSASFFYRDTTAGNPTLTVSRTGLTSATTAFTIAPPPPTVPSAPSKVTATAVTSTSVHVSWAASPGATGYQVFGATSAAGSFTALNTNPVTSPFVQTGLLPTREYFYKVKATNSAGTSAAFSPVDSATTPSHAINGNVTVSDAASCVAMGGILGDPGVGFVGGTCAIKRLTINPGATLTIRDLTLITRGGTIDNAGTISNGFSTNGVSGPGGILYTDTLGTISNGGSITNYYGSTFLPVGKFNQWCGSSFNNIGAWSPTTPVDACPGSTIFSASTPSQQVVFMASPGRFSSVVAIPESSLPTAGKPAGLAFPYGFFGWTVTGVTPGETVIVRMKFASNIPANSPYWQVVNGKWTNLTQLVGDNNGDNTLTLTIKDGGLEDADTVAGQVSDPGGFGIAAPPVTMSSTTMILLVSILLLVITNIVTYYRSRRDLPRPALSR